jgi:hypothetical protein
MNRLLCYLSVILFVLVVSSCGKKSDDDSNTTPIPTLLSKAMVWNAAEPQKSIQIIEFKYDDLKRVTEIAYSAGDSVNGTIQQSFVRSKKCYYNGDEKNPYKTTGFLLPLGYPSGDVYHYYDNTGLLIRDSTGTWRVNVGYYKREFAWFTDKITMTNTDIYSGFPRQSKDSMVIHNNIITQSFTNTTLAGSIDGYQYKYDNMINPLSKLNIAAFTITDGMDGFLAPGFCKNNITEMTKGYSTGAGTFTVTSTATFKYTYNDAGLPVERQNVSGSPYKSITKYYYLD